jgi:hypothetical protein
MSLEFKGGREEEEEARGRGTEGRRGGRKEQKEEGKETYVYKFYHHRSNCTREDKHKIFCWRPGTQAENYRDTGRSRDPFFGTCRHTRLCLVTRINFPLVWVSLCSLSLLLSPFPALSLVPPSFPASLSFQYPSSTYQHRRRGQCQ